MTLDLGGGVGGMVTPEGTSNGTPRAVREAINHLPDCQRVVMQLHRFQRLPFEKIAEMLATTPEAVRACASLAYEGLRKELRTYLRRD